MVCLSIRSGQKHTLLKTSPKPFMKINWSKLDEPQYETEILSLINSTLQKINDRNQCTANFLILLKMYDLMTPQANNYSSKDIPPFLAKLAIVPKKR
jgi:hypothetical protein